MLCSPLDIFTSIINCGSEYEYYYYYYCWRSIILLPTVERTVSPFNRLNRFIIRVFTIFFFFYIYFPSEFYLYDLRIGVFIMCKNGISRTPIKTVNKTASIETHWAYLELFNSVNKKKTTFIENIMSNNAGCVCTLFNREVFSDPLLYYIII